MHRKLTLDEVQHVPELFPAIKVAADRKREPGRFLLTGSANVLPLPKLSESLAGRMEVLTLWPFSQGEMKQVRERFIDALFTKQTAWHAEKSSVVRRGELLENALLGGYPPLVTRHTEARRKAWFQSYLMTILQRDVRDISNISDLTAVPRLLSVVAGRAGSLLNFADLSRSLSLPQTTLKRYFALLETTFLVLDTLVFWRQVHAPVLLIYGEHDQLVPVDESLATIEASLDTAKTPYAAVIVPNAHNLTLQPEPNAPFFWWKAAPGIVDLVVAWAQQRTTEPVH